MCHVEYSLCIPNPHNIILCGKEVVYDIYYLVWDRWKKMSWTLLVISTWHKQLISISIFLHASQVMNIIHKYPQIYLFQPCYKVLQLKVAITKIYVWMLYTCTSMYVHWVFILTLNSLFSQLFVFKTKCL